MVIQRSCSVCMVLVLCIGVSSLLGAQVFPDQEYLDVVTLSDGTVLKGVITETVPDRYLEIKLYGGSTFVLAFAQIEAVERQLNPDYATTWIKVDLDALSRAQAGPGDGSAGASPGQKEPKSVKDGELVLGLQSPGPMVRWVSGPDWDDFVESVSDDAESSARFEGEFGGLFIRYLAQPAFAAGTPWVVGVRGGFTYTFRSGHIIADDFNASGEAFEYNELIRQYVAPAELLGGISSDRFALVAGLGTALVFLDGTPTFEIIIGGDEIETDEGGEFDTDRDVTLSLVTSLSAIARLRSWQFDLRLYYDRQFIAWTDDPRFYPQAVGLSLGVGYRLGQ